MAPLYDAATTRVFPLLERDRMALKLNGKDDRRRRADFKALVTTAGIRSGDADRVIDAVVQAVGAAAADLTLPPFIASDRAAAEAAVAIRSLVTERIESLGQTRIIRMQAEGLAAL